MAELMVVVGIIAILCALGFVGIVSYLRSLTKLEYDGYAKEIFVAAQNHLSMAKSQGYLKRSGFGDPDSETDVKYFFVTGEDRDEQYGKSKVLDLILPFGSVDETLRGGGCYIIRYQQKAGEVLDVFYWSEVGRYPYNKYASVKTAYENDYKNFLSSRDADLKNYTYGGNTKAVIGYFGGEDASSLKLGAELNQPKISVDNAERLVVKVTDTNPTKTNEELKLIITGAKSKASRTIVLRSPQSGKITEGDDISGPGTDDKYEIILDDITSDKGLHFYDRYCRAASDNGKFFVPGENVTLQAVASYKNELANVAYSYKRTTNSLFASVNEKKESATVSNIRHLENLDDKVSNLNLTSGPSPSQVPMQIKNAAQKADLSWTKFVTAIGGSNVGIYAFLPKGASATTKNTRLTKTSGSYYYPVIFSSVTNYDGGSHSIFDVSVDHTDSGDAVGAGLFGTLNNKEIKDLRLVDFIVKGNGNAGALAGRVNGTKVTNVIAFHSGGYGLLPSEAQIQGGSGTGGLIGYVGTFGSGTNYKISEIKKCAASHTVASTGGNAGGLIGDAEDAEFSACYAGGHTGNGSYAQIKQGALIVYNVTAAGYAGGFIGNAGNSRIEHSYATCSVDGSTAAGGFAGYSEGFLNYCYATGLINVPKDAATGESVTTGKGAFAGAFGGDPLNVNGCTYFEIINEITKDGEIAYLGSGLEGERILPFDQMPLTGQPASYYVSGTEPGSGALDWGPAVAYDATLIFAYQGRFDLPTVSQLQRIAGVPVTIEDTDYVAVHYGDWPAPEVWVKND